MDKMLHSLFTGAFALIRAPLLIILMASVVVSLVRHRPQRLAVARARRPQLPR